MDITYGRTYKVFHQVPHVLAQVSGRSLKIKLINMLKTESMTLANIVIIESKISLYLHCMVV